MRKILLRLRVNGAHHEVAVRPSATVLDVVRDTLHLTGTKRGCDMGTCGCCTVLVDGRARLGCLTLAAEVEGCEVRTIESLREGEQLHPLQSAFAECGAAQCGFCTPGFLMTCSALLSRTPAPTADQVKDAISGNLCRCTGYTKMYEAIDRAAAQMRTEPAREPEMSSTGPVSGGSR